VRVVFRATVVRERTDEAAAATTALVVVVVTGGEVGVLGAPSSLLSPPRGRKEREVAKERDKSGRFALKITHTPSLLCSLFSPPLLCACDYCVCGDWRDAAAVLR
jgi:hypothetical protein